MLVLHLSDGSKYTIDATLIACVRTYRYGAIGDSKASEFCEVFWVGGGSVRLSAKYYDEIVRIWQTKLGLTSEKSSSKQGLEASDSVI